MRIVQNLNSTKHIDEVRPKSMSPKIILSIGVLALVLVCILNLLVRRQSSAGEMSLAASSTKITSTANSVDLDFLKHNREANETSPHILATGDLVHVGANLSWVQNYKGELLHTRNAGASWVTVGGETPKQFDAFTFLDEYRGLAVGREGQIWRTDDSGYNWYPTRKLEPEDPNEYYMSATQILFNGDRTGWVVDTLGVWRTLDGGWSWREVKDLSFDKLDNRVRKIDFINDRVGWAICEGLMLQTSDGGLSWQSVVDKLSLDLIVNINAAYFLNESRGWMALSYAPKPFPDNVVLRTEDRGKTWNPQKEIGSDVSIDAIFFLDHQTGWMAGGKRAGKPEHEIGVIFQTQDGGDTWRRMEMNSITTALKSIFFTSAEEGWLTTDDGVWRTHDGGQTWQAVLSYPEVKRKNAEAERL